MNIKASYKALTLQFKFPAGTSRGVMHDKLTYFLILEQNGIKGIGECSTIPGLSIDDPEEYENKINQVCNAISDGINPEAINLTAFPSIRFGLETALLDLKSGGNRILFPGNFASGKEGISINGLVWMGSPDFMMFQVDQKVKSGFRCIKIKVGALNFETELEILTEIRKKYHDNDLEIRLDANGAFHPSQALEKLNKLAEFNIHSIEQPIPAQRLDSMTELCSSSPIPIVLDEELIGISEEVEMKKIINEIKPQYIILKPSLIGGFEIANKWLSLIKGTSTEWWLTSALESNIGLNALAQWVSAINPKLPQGLGTGQLYTNNIPSPLVIENDKLYYKPDINWDLNAIIQ